MAKGFQKGHKKIGGKQKGSKNKRTETWEAFANYCLNGGLERFRREMDSLKGKQFTDTFLSILEFHKPKQARTEIMAEVDNTINFAVKRTVISKNADKS